MKLLIGGKSRNIYMRKDGSAYYKSGGQQVDVTYMFKKKGGGLKKKYIKGGMNKAKFTELKEKCNTLRDKLKELHGKLAPHTFTDSGNPTTKDFITNDIIKDNFEGSQLLTKLADEINDASSSYINGGVPEYDALMKLLKQAEVSKGIKSLLSDGGDGTIQKDLEDIAAATAANFNTKQTALLARLNFFENVITEIGQIGETSDDANVVTISTIVPKISALSKFSGYIDNFDQEFLDLAHLLISVINTLRKNSKIIMKSENSNEIKKQVKKLNALITLFEMSDKNANTNTGVFLKSSFIKDVINVKRTSVFLEIKSKENEYSVSKKGELLNDEKIFKIFSVIGEICKLNSTNLAYGISKKLVAQNLRDFLQSDDHAVIEITNSKESKKSDSD